ncbi:uncharacterized protein G2W53_000940 [Senna tora]|uniref:Uncharacterized protein n=1 Tax=Senna tora TaxID=362788 RepID=A0A834SYN4_9FABA|nr:uncharacterized protein G2W53_033132 [Senna tora]KAF7844035.1 uncharacterized protein G2W53_000940 [Senna tora]
MEEIMSKSMYINQYLMTIQIMVCPLALRLNRLTLLRFHSLTLLRLNKLRLSSFASLQMDAST